MDLPALNDRYDRLWTKAERLVESFLDQQLAALEAVTPAITSVEPTIASADSNSKGRAPSRPRRTRSKPVTAQSDVRHPPSAIRHPPSEVLPPPAANLPSPTAAPLRDIYIAVQCLKRIHEGRQAILTGGTHDLQPLGSNDPAKTVAEEISRRIRALCEPGRPNGDDEDPV